MFGAAAGFFVFGRRSVPFDRAVRFLWGVYCRRRRGFVFGYWMTAAEVIAVLRKNKTGRRCSERQRVFCVRASVGAV